MLTDTYNRGCESEASWLGHDDADDTIVEERTEASDGHTAETLAGVQRESGALPAVRRGEGMH